MAAIGTQKQSLEEAVSCPEYRERLKEVYITAEQIQARIAELAKSISEQHRSAYKDGEVVAVGHFQKGVVCSDSVVPLSAPPSLLLLPLPSHTKPDLVTPSSQASLCIALRS